MSAGVGVRPTARPRGRAIVLAAAWTIATAWLAASLAAGARSFDEAGVVVLGAGVALSAALIWWLLPLGAPPGEPGAGRLAFAASIVGALAVLGGAYAVFGRPWMLLAVVAAALALAGLLRRFIARRDAALALAYGAVAAVAGLGAGWIEGIPLEWWAALQLPLVTASLLAGWALFRASDLAHGDLAPVVLWRDSGAALRGAVFGALLAVPWGLLNARLGGATGDDWVTAPWQALIAVQPAVSEEAWGRVFLVTAAYVWLRRVASPTAALVGAVLVVGYWFAFLHVRDLSIGGLISTLFTGTIGALPLSLLWLRRGLEAAIGFHFTIDALRFLFAYLVSSGAL